MHNPVIHVVDDQQLMRDVVRHILIQGGISQDIVSHSSAKSLLSTLERGDKCDVVLSDWNMPEMSGLEMLKQLRANPHSRIRNMPVILVTGELKAENVQDAAQAGVSGYIAKPFQPNVLLQRVRSVLETL